MDLAKTESLLITQFLSPPMSESCLLINSVDLLQELEEKILSSDVAKWPLKTITVRAVVKRGWLQASLFRISKMLFKLTFECLNTLSIDDLSIMPADIWKLKLLKFGRKMTSLNVSVYLQDAESTLICTDLTEIMLKFERVFTNRAGYLVNWLMLRKHVLKHGSLGIYFETYFKNYEEAKAFYSLMYQRGPDDFGLEIYEAINAQRK